MHIHILGICGTFMGGIAAIAKAMGHTVTGSDANVYPPMSTQLEELGIELTQGYSPEQFSTMPDMVVIGNAMSRGNPAVEYVLEKKLPYTSGPQWLLEHVLKDCWVLAVSGTHGKTTTSGMLAWILEYAGMHPGFLIGGIPGNFALSARVGETPFFVIEADEYDSAFFDKRSKFVHYRPNTLIINNLEFDHADIFEDMAAIRKQFHHMLRMVPGNGLVIAPADDSNIAQTLEMGCWTPVEYLGQQWAVTNCSADGSQFDVLLNNEPQGQVNWSLLGQHNVSNGMMAIAAARHVGVTPAIAIEALAEFKNVKRRMELRGIVNHISVYDDFAHHPTAIATTLEGLRAKAGKQRILAVLEPRSNTMKLGIHQKTLADSWQSADQVFIFEPDNLNWDISTLSSETDFAVYPQLDTMTDDIIRLAQKGDNILVMSNGGFGGIHQTLLDKLAEKFNEK